MCRPQSARLYSNNRVRASAGSSPWDSEGSRAGTPEILTVGEEGEDVDSELQAENGSAGMGRTASAAKGLSRFVNAAGEEIEIAESAAAEAGRSSGDGQAMDKQQMVTEMHEMAIGTDAEEGGAVEGKQNGLKVKQPLDKAATGEAGNMLPVCQKLFAVK